MDSRADVQDRALLKALLIGILLGIAAGEALGACSSERLEQIRADIRAAQKEVACKIDHNRCGYVGSER